MRFTGKHVLVTGAARGLGLEIALHFAREGAVLSLIDNEAGNLEKAASSISATGRVAGAFAIDVSDNDAVDQAVQSLDDSLPIDVLVNNAGIAEETPFLQITPAAWKKILDVNLTGMFYVARAVCQRMATRKKGVVINMGSKNGMDAEFGYAHYNASKGGVLMLTKTMAVELAHLNIRVNSVCPGYIQTPMSEEIDSPDFVRNFADRYIPMNRPGKPHEVAPLFLFLASDESSFITGQSFVIDGGQLAGQKPGSDLLNRAGI